MRFKFWETIKISRQQLLSTNIAWMFPIIAGTYSRKCWVGVRYHGPQQKSASIIPGLRRTCHRSKKCSSLTDLCQLHHLTTAKNEVWRLINLSTLKTSNLLLLLSGAPACSWVQESLVSKTVGSCHLAPPSAKASAPTKSNWISRAFFNQALAVLILTWITRVNPLMAP
jgi:hypothetical protein